MENLSGIKELYDVNIRLNNPLKTDLKTYSINESILSFSTVEIAQLNQQQHSIAATGGFNDQNLINWDTDKEMTFGLSHGVLSPMSWALLSNSLLKTPHLKSVSFNELLPVIEDELYCFVDLKHCPNNCEPLGAQPNPYFEPIPMGRRPELKLKPLPPTRKRWIFCYDMETGEKIKDFEIFKNRIFFSSSVRRVLVDYTFDYVDDIKTIEIGNRLFNGFLRLDGKMSVKDQNSGEVSTAILELPKIKLSSNLSMRLGKSYEFSIVSDFLFVAYPDDTKNRNEQAIAYITFLDKELTGDYI